MPSSPISICNMALSHLAVGTRITSFDEKTAEARACAEFYEQARDEVLCAAEWPFATAYTDLALVQEQPNPEWDYSYRYPADCIQLRRVLPGGPRRYAQICRVPVKLGRDSVGQLIFTDQAQAKVEYTMLVTDAAQYPPDFVQCVALLLAHYIAPRLAKGDDFRLATRAFQLYQHKVAVARAHQFNQEQQDQPPEAELMRARN